MKLQLILPLWALLTVSQQEPQKCSCELKSSGNVFPQDKLDTVKDKALRCNNNISPQKALELESLLLGLDHRLPQLQEDVSLLEREDDGELYAVVSLQVIENELRQINELVDRLNRSTVTQQQLTRDTAEQLDDLKADMKELETYDALRVVETQRANQRLRRDLDQCRTEPVPIWPTRPHSFCPHGRFENVTGPRVFTAGEYPGSYKYGSWGRDPKPEPGKESWYWRVMLTSGNKFSNYVRLYSSLSSLIVGVSTPGNVQIHSANPTTNTIQGPNVVLYGGALYYNCYNQDAVCRFNLTSKVVSSVTLPKGTRFNSKANFCQLDECYHFTDLDLATDESGVWVVYTTSQDFGNLVLSKVEEGDPPTLGQSWRSSVYKQAVTNTFMACGVLYAMRYVDKDVEEIFYSLDTATGEESFKVGVFINKMSSKIYALNYSPVDQTLHAYCDGNMASYKVQFSQ